MHHSIQEVKQEPHLHSLHKQEYNRDAEILQRRYDLLHFHHVNFFIGGTKKEQFQQYLEELVTAMQLKYPNHQLVFVMDNCASHKTSLTMKVMQEEQCHLLFTAPNSP